MSCDHHFNFTCHNCCVSLYDAPVYPLETVVLPEPRNLKFGAKVSGPNPRNFQPNEEKITYTQVLYGIGDEAYRPVAYAPNIVNELTALKARVLADTPILDGDYTNRCILFVKQQIQEIFPKTSRCRVVSDSFQRYINNSNANPDVKRQLRETQAVLDECGINENCILDNSELRNWTSRKSFLKVENNVYRSELGQKLKAGRLIQGAQPQFICIVGPWISSLQRKIKRDWNKNNFICFTSGVKSDDAAKVLTQGVFPYILEDDVGKWDASIRKEWCDFELWLAEYFGAPRLVLDLMRANIYTHGYTSKGFKYKVLGTRKSGDPYTSLFNSILNGLMHLFIFCDVKGCSVKQARQHFRMLVQGDDNLMCHSRLDVVPDWVGCMAKFGFESEALYRRNIEEAEFCSSRIYPTKQGYTFGPKPGRVLSKLGYFVNPPHPKVATGVQLVRGTALGLYSSCSHIPPLRSYLDHLLKLTHGEIPYFGVKPDHELRGSNFESNVDTMMALNTVYGWGYGMQMEFEKILECLPLNTYSTFPFYRYLCDRDTLGPSSFDWNP